MKLQSRNAKDTSEVIQKQLSITEFIFTLSNVLLSAQFLNKQVEVILIKSVCLYIMFMLKNRYCKDFFLQISISVGKASVVILTYTVQYFFL